MACRCRRIHSTLGPLALALGVFIATGAGAQVLVLPLFRPGFAREPAAAAYVPVARDCPRVRVVERENFNFTAMEIRLMCGDRAQDAIGAAWADVPANQAAYFLRGFLQVRGYQEPSFAQDGDVLFADPGKLSRLTSFRLTGNPADWRPPHLRLVVGRPLTPSLLDELQGWALTQIKNEGYACATARTRADPKTGEVVTNYDLGGGPRVITALEDIGDTGLRPGVLDRYSAFKLGSLYRDYLIQLTRRRTQDDGFLQNLSITPRCVEGGVKLVRDVILGPSRSFSIGIGGSTDEGARARSVVRQSRIGESASSAQARINVSYLNDLINRQAIDSSYRWYYSRVDPRAFLEPVLTFEHSANTSLENQSFQAQVMHGWSRELTDARLELRVGPTFLDSHLFRGRGPSDVTATFVEVNARYIEHLFEFNSSSPRTGGTIEAVGLATFHRWGAQFTAQKIQIRGEKLWSVLDYDPPLLILGTRFELSSVFSPREDISPQLPTRFLTFFGGDPDLRGYDHSSLPRSGVGALSGATASFEARWHKVIFRRADVFGFLDAGLMGGARFALLPPYFMSPGAGLRWESPIGVFRLYLANRFALAVPPAELPYDNAWRLGLTFGEEF